MDRSRETATIFLLFLFIRAEAQHQPQQASAEHELNPLRPSMAVVLTVLAIMFCLTLLIVAYAKFCQTIQPHADDPQGIVRTRSRFSGIDRTVIESLPFFRFSSLKGAKDGLECAVCLSRFEETEVLRLLPKCRHAFHISCIDKWLENHSTCPLCRYRINVGDVKSLSYSTGSFRLPRVSGDDLEFFIQREENQRRSSRFNLLNWGNREEPLIQESGEGTDKKILHSVKHKIIVPDVILKSRWSDVNSSDMMSLNSEMLKEMSEAKGGVSAREQMMKIKEDMERKRLYESKNVSRNGEASGWKDDELERSTASKPLDPGEKRSMSEITNVSRFTGSRRYSNVEKDEEVRRVWLPIARRTIQWFSGRETGSESEERKHSINV